jgi:fatty acid desaturase
MPIIEAVSFLIAVILIPTYLLLTVLFLGLAALAMCFALHMSYHEVAHRSGNWSAWRQLLTGVFLTPLLGVAFHGYRISHWNHHRYDNGLQDFTTTWKEKNGQPVPKGLFSYCASWPAIFAQAPMLYRKAASDGDATNRDLSWSRLESLFLLVWVLFLYWLRPEAAILYLVLVYVGWMLISLHNYGQHLPTDYETRLRTTSYTASWYNRLFFNNGLHSEHHRRPSVPIAKLQSESESELVSAPHLLAPFKRRS